jgi:ribA/ribD-fused uncharacterized protein
MTHPFASSPTPAAGAAPITRFREEHRFLSNFWFVPGGVTVGGLTGATTEHVFQALKTLAPSERAQILAAPTPGEAKILGGPAHRGGIITELRPHWEEIKLGVMARLQAAKYAQPDMAQLLLATGDAELVEGNHWDDTFWGRCTCRKGHDDEGENWLGRILMIQRSVLQS